MSEDSPSVEPRKGAGASKDEEKPRLQAVPGPQGSEETPSADDRGGLDEGPPAPSPKPRRSVLPWLLAAAAVVFALLWLSQVSENRVLGDRVGALESELAGARSALDAYSERMGAVRSQVDEVVGSLAALQALVMDDPRAPAPSAAVEAGETVEAFEE